jgi:hypothetical protein
VKLTGRVQAFDLVHPRPNPNRHAAREKPRVWIKCGRAFLTADGMRLDIHMDSIPIDFDGKLIVFFARQSEEKEEKDGS